MDTNEKIIKLIGVAILHWGLAFFTPALATTQGCSFDDAVGISTILTVAPAAGIIAGNPAGAHAMINRGLSKLPPSCREELDRAKNSNLAATCAAYSSVITDSSKQMERLGYSYAQTGDYAGFFGGVFDAMKNTLESLPRECWFAPVTVTATSNDSSSPSRPSRSECYACKQKLKRCIVRTKGTGPCNTCPGCEGR